MRINRFIKLVLAALFAVVLNAGPALADHHEEKEKAKAGSEMSKPAEKGTPPVEAAPPADAKNEEGAKAEKAEKAETTTD